MNKYSFHISGMRCHSCKILIEDYIKEQPGVLGASVNLSKQTLVVETETRDTPEKLVADWSKILLPHKYHLSLEKQKTEYELKSLIYAIPLGAVILGLFFLLQKSGFIHFGFSDKFSFWTAFFIGIIASLSSCLAVVGGLVLSLSAKLSQGISTARPLIFFHSGRIISFAVLGGILGVVGEVIAINNSVMSALGIFVSLAVIILGINLLDIFHFTKSLQFVLPRKIFDFLTRIKRGFFAPFIVGIATFFLPCGFTQSMQFAALSGGSFMSGFAIMGMFALGTFPVLALISFGSFSFAHTRYAQLFFKTAGVVVIGLGLFSFLTGLAGLGIIKPFFNF